MDDAALSARMELAQAEVDRACECLLHPAQQTLDACLEALNAAAGNLRECRDSWPGRGGNAALLPQASHLRSAVRRASILLNTAADYHGKWLRILRARMTGYTAGGNPGEVACESRINLKG